MFIELVDALRCPDAHEESWLVLASTHMEHRHVVTGTLGCPVCSREFPIEHGVVDFRAGGDTIIPPPRIEPRGDDAVRLAAFLHLTDASGFAVLVGEWGTRAYALAGIVETPLVLVDPPGGTAGSPGISVVRTDGPIPLATGSARGVAIDGGDAARVAQSVRITKTAGRVVAPISASVPAGVCELARDEQWWVAEREAMASPPVTLHVRRAL